MRHRYRQPELLADRHDLSEFRCRSEEQTQWLRHHARQSRSGGTARVFVVCEQESESVVAYYAWCMSQLKPEEAPSRLLKGSGRYPQPVALLARLGVDFQREGSGLGSGLLQDVFRRLAQLDEEIGCKGLLAHAESDEAREFYLHLIPEFAASPTDDLHLVLLMKDIRRTLSR